MPRLLHTYLPVVLKHTNGMTPHQAKWFVLRTDIKYVLIECRMVANK